MGTEVTFTSGRMKGQLGTVVDVRHEGHHIRVNLEGGQKCTACNGTGKTAVWMFGKQHDCAHCEGDGWRGRTVSTRPGAIKTAPMPEIDYPEIPDGPDELQHPYDTAASARHQADYYRDFSAKSGSAHA
jgi:hypothetical protein